MKRYLNSISKSFLAHHAPILDVLKPGVVSVFESDENTKRFSGKWSCFFSDHIDLYETQKVNWLNWK